MAPPFLLLLLLVGIVGAQDNYDTPTVDLVPRHHHEKRQEQQQIAACERELRKNHGESFCYEYLNYPRTATVSTTTTTTKFGQPVTRTERTAVVETYTVTRTMTKHVTFTTTTTTKTITAPPTTTFTAKKVRRAEIPLPWYLHRRFTARQIRAACENYIDPSSSITVTRTRTRAVFNRETVLTTRTYTRRSKEATTTTKFRSTSTVTATETTTVRHPCDYLFRATHVESWSVNNVSPDLAAFELNTDSVGETECCRRCWDESQCNGWMYFQNKDCYRLVGSSGPGATDTCPNGFVHFDTSVSSSAPGGDIIGQGPCGHLSATK